MDPKRGYLIIKGRKTVKNVLRKCVVCKRFQGKPLRSPASPDLPEFRVDHSGCALIQVTGLDFAGPLYVKNNLNNDKVYMLLLTCASSRAIHLELTTDICQLRDFYVDSNALLLLVASGIIKADEPPFLRLCEAVHTY